MYVLAWWEIFHEFLFADFFIILTEDKKMSCFSGHFLETDAAGWAFIFSKQKQMRELFLNTNDIPFKSCALTVISSDIIQDRP